MNYNNFSISKGKGKLYLKSKTPQEGYEKVIYGTDNSVTYHQYHNSTQGVPSFFGVKEIEYQGRTLRFLELSLVDGDTTNKISVNLKNKGGYTDEAKALFSSLRDLEMGERVSINPKHSTSTGKNGKTYENFNIYVNYLDRTGANGKNPSTGYIHYDELPKPTKKEVAGDTVWDFSAQAEFYYGVQQAIEAKFKGDTPTKPTSTVEPPKQVKAVVDTEETDLPF